MKLNGKTVNLLQLQAELTAAGVAIRGLGTAGDDLHTYDPAGAIVDLPAGAAAVVAAHVPPPAPAVPDFGTDGTTADQVADGVTQLRAYLGAASPTPAQTVGAVKLLIRVVLFVLRRFPGGLA